MIFKRDIAYLAMGLFLLFILYGLSFAMLFQGAFGVIIFVFFTLLIIVMICCTIKLKNSKVLEFTDEQLICHRSLKTKREINWNDVIGIYVILGYTYGSRRIDKIKSRDFYIFYKNASKYLQPGEEKQNNNTFSPKNDDKKSGKICEYQNSSEQILVDDFIERKIEPMKNSDSDIETIIIQSELMCEELIGFLKKAKKYYKDVEVEVINVRTKPITIDKLN